MRVFFGSTWLILPGPFIIIIVVNFSTMQCKNCSQTFTVENPEIYEKLGVPQPTKCPICRQQNLYAYRNERSLYPRDCDKCGEYIISTFPSDTDKTAYCLKCWWGDEWDPLSYGRDYDFSRPFFEQFNELLSEVPLASIIIGGDSENSDYTSWAMDNKNCYLISSSDYNQDCLYSSYIFKCSDCSDCLFVSDCELCYGCIDSRNCYSGLFLKSCHSCSECLFCEGCRGCQRCIGCVNLRNKENYIFNKPCTPEEYEAKKKEILANPDGFKREFLSFKLNFPHRSAELENCVDCSGDFLMRCKNCKNCFDLVESEDCYNSVLGINAKDCVDSVGLPKAELCYQVAGCPENYDIKFSALIWPKSSYLQYCMFCRSSNNCFGCVSLNKNEYCILNKQYTKEEYEALVPKIIEHMQSTGEYGEFFPISMSPSAYNETVAQDCFPLEKKEALARGYKWRDEEESKAYADDASQCKCGKYYRLVDAEKDLYKKLGLSEPVKCPNCRHRERWQYRNPRYIWDRQCGKCGVALKSSFAPERQEAVYCEECFLDAIE